MAADVEDAEAAAESEFKDIAYVLNEIERRMNSTKIALVAVKEYADCMDGWRILMPR